MDIILHHASYIMNHDEGRTTNSNRTVASTATTKTAASSRFKEEQGQRQSSMISFRYAVIVPAIFVVLYCAYQYLQRGTIVAFSRSQSLECDFYLAESTIPNAGWGLFTSKMLYEHQMINLTNGESGISIVDLTTEHGKYLNTLYRNYMWNADVIGSHNEGGGRTVYTRTGTGTGTASTGTRSGATKQSLPGNVLTMITGIGVLANGHPLDYNMVPYQIPIPHPPLQSSATDDADETTEFVISRHSNSPTTGAITYYHHLQYFAYKNHEEQHPGKNVIVPAGGELIINYGTGWNARFDFSQYRIHPPKRRNQNVHSLQHLQRRGYCIDNIASTYPYVSKLVPSAGYGGVARRAISNNSVIVPIPTIPIHRYGLYMGTIDTTDEKNGNKEEVDEEFDEFDGSASKPVSSSTRMRQQLLLNYVFGHVHSNVLLVPYGPGIQLINHHSTQYNAILRWSTGAAATTERRPLWVIDPEQISMQQLMEEQPSGKLVLELVAIRDIEPGEEILIHYGTAWEEAYNRHVLEWERTKHESDEYVYAYDMNQRIEHQVLLRTEKEQMNDPYPFNLQVECYYIPNFYHEVTKHTMANEQNYSTGSNDGNSYVEWNPIYDSNSINTKQIYHPNQLRPCQILHRHETTMEQQTLKQYLYTVQLMDVPYKIHNVPRHMILFRDVTYTQDQYLQNVFRHEIQLSDDVFPHHWKDLM